MVILHYALGFPPYRSGGLTKYVMDLMQEQLRQGEQVAMLWPGAYGIFRRSIWIEHGSDINGIQSYELRNPLPVPLLDGIKDISSYTKDGKTDAYGCFLKALRPDVIHVHTLMGLHRDFFEAAFELKIPIVYTAHDHFPLCPKVTLFCRGEVCSGIGAGCSVCNQNALPFWKIALLQSKSYRRIKDSHMMQWMRSRHKKVKGRQEGSLVQVMAKDTSANYKSFFAYNKECLSYVSCIHYGSRMTQLRYEKQGIDIPGRCIGLTHGGIRDSRSLRKTGKCIQFAFLAEPLPYKGFGILLEAMDELWTEGLENFRLHIYSRVIVKKAYIVQHEPYQYGEMDSVMKDINMVIVPSLCAETYGFVVLEALNYGVPVIASENVGAKELICDPKRQKGIVVKPDQYALKKAIRYLCEHPEKLDRFAGNILEDTFDYQIEKHCREIRQLYDQVQKEKEYEKQCGYHHTHL